MDYFVVEQGNSAERTGSIEATHRWGLPGILRCPQCKATWSGSGKAYPSVDLTPMAALDNFEEPRAEPIEAYERLRELIQPLLPSGALLEPGTELGPLVGRAQGVFGSFAFSLPWVLLARREALERLQAEKLRGLHGHPTALRFRQRTPPEWLELELLPLGRLHPACLPTNRAPPCPRCHRSGLSLPGQPVLDEATLPSETDLFRLEDFSTLLVCTERFVTACQRLGLDGIAFRPVPTRREGG